jgi:chromosome segregation ATPase
MTSADERERVARWLDEMHAVLTILGRTVDEHARLSATTQAAERHADRLTGENLDLRDRIAAATGERDQLRADVERLRAECDVMRIELGQCRKEREELAALVGQVATLLEDVNRASRAFGFASRGQSGPAAATQVV